MRTRVQEPEELAKTLLELRGDDVQERAAAILKGWPVETEVEDEEFAEDLERVFNAVEIANRIWVEIEDGVPAEDADSVRLTFETLLMKLTILCGQNPGPEETP